MPAGRPSLYNEDIAAEICARLSEGQSLRTICLDEEMPDASTIFRWLPKHDEFRKQYDAARAAASDAMVEDILEIADDATNDWMKQKQKNGEASDGWILNGDHVQRSKVRIDTRKWIMSRLAPKKYGDRVTNQLVGENDGPIKTEDTSATQKLEAYLSVIEKRSREAGDTPAE